ncbi:methyltransferase domain-containing protein [Streptomyces sp. NPDC012794]|uniref:methyltransferase domain-containing protein n=1 Tax=Streptomyces sp. NPDC012794 TaxID=3364850 RepID=UPI003698D0D3
MAAHGRPRLVPGLDRSAAFMAAARTAAAEADAPGTAACAPLFAVADAQALPVRDGTFDAAVSALTPNNPSSAGRVPRPATSPASPPAPAGGCATRSRGPCPYGPTAPSR